MITAVCPGSFDPVTYGHLDIIRRAASMFDRVIVLVVTNLAKQPMFTKEERMDFLRRATSGLDNVEVDSYGGLLADYTREHDARVIVKGLRAMSDFEYEFQMALTNRRLNPEAETVFLTTTAENMYLSSSLVKQVAVLGGEIRDFVPACIVADIRQKIGSAGPEKE
ncbi:MAG: pantetheine-phosphate adenylyltransferase [Acutalibacteraceae bacterium]|nr:pantetheine-phosphate adenylyltransferase [Clostridiales bacterium]